jgi:hypothetical protein
MIAVVCYMYGSPDVFRHEEMETPAPKDNPFLTVGRSQAESKAGDQHRAPKKCETDRRLRD